MVRREKFSSPVAGFGGLSFFTSHLEHSGIAENHYKRVGLILNKSLAF